MTVGQCQVLLRETPGSIFHYDAQVLCCLSTGQTLSQGADPVHTSAWPVPCSSGLCLPPTLPSQEEAPALTAWSFVLRLPWMA